PERLPSILRYFEIWILKLEGFLPDLRRCAACHRLLAEEDRVLVTAQSGLLCRTCANGKGEVLSGRAYSKLRATQNLSPQVFAVQCRDLSAKVHRELAAFTHRMIGRALERQPRVQPTFQSVRLQP